MKSKGTHRYAADFESPIQEQDDIGGEADQAADTVSIDSYNIIEDPEMDRTPLPQRVMSNLNIQHT